MVEYRRHRENASLFFSDLLSSLLSLAPKTKRKKGDLFRSDGVEILSGFRNKEIFKVAVENVRVHFVLSLFPGIAVTLRVRSAERPACFGGRGSI